MMNKNTNFPLVSLLVANFNNSEFIVETLNSALSQTYSNIEIVIVDDASTIIRRKLFRNLSPKILKQILVFIKILRITVAGEISGSA